MLDKSVAVLRATAAAPCTLVELCERTGLPRATAHRLAVGLETHRLLTRDVDGRWSPGPALGELAHGHGDPLLEAAEEVLPRLRDRTGESVQLYRRDGDARVCVAAAEPASGLRDTVPVGIRLPMTAGSGAQVLAAWADPLPSSVADGGSGAGADRGTDARADPFPAALLTEVRRRGWAESVAEREAGVASASAPVRAPGGEVVAAVSVSGPVERMGHEPGARFADDLRAAAAALERSVAPTVRDGVATPYRRRP